MIFLKPFATLVAGATLAHAVVLPERTLTPRQSSSVTDEMALISERRRFDMAQFPSEAMFANVSAWLGSQAADGTWADVDYTSGCAAQRANWPIQQHWIRVITLASAWSGLNAASPSDTSGSGEYLAAALKGMDWYFANDLNVTGCLTGGGGSACPCSTPGLWNTNWFSNVILIPQLASTACMIVYPSGLTDTQKAACDNIPRRVYDRRDSLAKGGYMTGANMVNIMQNIASLALYSNDSAMLTYAMDMAMGTVTFSDAPPKDGIYRDGSFLQHNGILYNGNYGKDLLNAFIQLEGEAIGTSFAANDSQREAAAALVKGDEWMIYVDEETKQEHWDFNVIGRFVAFKTTDLQANADINFNVSKLANATADFVGANSLTETIERLQSNGTIKLVGNRGFWSSDYMVHRRDRYMVTNKMLSSRSVNSEWANGANPWGYHLGQGTLWSYVKGTEYRDIQAQWDWNLIPGTTVLLRAPPLNASVVMVSGVKPYVGVVSDGDVGASAMDYIDPYYKSIAFRKAWFFLDDSVLVTTTAVQANRTVPGVGDAPAVSVLDQRAADPACGTIAIIDGHDVDVANGVNVSATTLEYGGNGYLSHGAPFNLTLTGGPATGNWSAISTSSAGVDTADLFAAYTTIPDTTFSYEFFPAVSNERMCDEARRPSTTPIDAGGTLGAAGHSRLALVFWPGTPDSVTVPNCDIGWAKDGDFTVKTSTPVLVLFKLDKRHGAKTIVGTVADPTQKLTSVSLTVTPTGFEGCAGEPVTIDVALPTGPGMKGSSATFKVHLK